VVLNVSDAVLQVEGVEMAADGQTLVESLVGGQAQGITQAGLADEQERGQGMFVDDQQREALIEALCNFVYHDLLRSYHMVMLKGCQASSIA